MDIVVFTLLQIFTLIPCMLGLLGNRAGWQMVSIFGIAVGGVGILALYTDGNLTQNGNTLAAANGNFVSDFNAISVIPLSLTLACVVVMVRRIFKI